jgi:acylpyruvate hydrolase
VTAAGTVAACVDADVVTEIGVPDLNALLDEADRRTRAESARGRQHHIEEVRLAPVVPRPHKVLCVGLNYLDHIRETGNDPPTYPTLFTKFGSTLCGAFDDLVLPSCSNMVDWEAELAFVVGRPARRITGRSAADYIAGFTVLNDVSVRDWQRRTSQWDQGKNFEATTPVGPMLVTPDECGCAADLRITCTVDGLRVQDSRTVHLVFAPSDLVSYISTFTTLLPGDLVATGTPGGVGVSMNPPTFLRPGQIVETEIEGLGACRNRCVSENL